MNPDDGQKTCYRCEAVLPELIDSSDPFSGYHGACDSCRLSLEAIRLIREGRPFTPLHGRPS